MRLADYVPLDRVPRMSRDVSGNVRLVSEVLRMAGVNEAAFFRNPSTVVKENNAAALACFVLLERRGVPVAEAEGYIGRRGCSVEWDPKAHVFRRRGERKRRIQCSELAVQLIEQYERTHGHGQDGRGDDYSQSSGRRLDVPARGKRHRVVRDEAG